jgi:putative Holliday junction resolvase
MDGTRGPMAERVLAFGERLRRRCAIPVHTFDERLSSMAADRALREGGLDERARREVRDRVAAQVILQAYLDAHAGDAAEDAMP